MTLVFTHCREDLLVAMGAPASEEPGESGTRPENTAWRRLWQQSGASEAGPLPGRLEHCEPSSLALRTQSLTLAGIQ